MIAGFDTNIISFLRSRSPLASDDRLSLQRRAIRLFDRLERERTPIILPYLVVGEFLSALGGSERRGTLEELRSQFLFAEFAEPSATIAAELWNTVLKTPIRRQYEGQRVVLKTDLLIVANAAAAGVTDFYSHDSKCSQLAGLAGMQGHDLPER